MESQNLLNDIRVIEPASVISGPFAGMMLAHLGAEVIKVEPPNGGDPFRGWDPSSTKVTPSFSIYNQGKKSIVIDLKAPEGRDIYTKLCATAHVVIENSRPGTMDRLNIGWDTLRKINPSLVYCYISGMGSWGPESNKPTFDAVAQALSGLWSQFTEMNDPEPVGPPMADQLTGLYAAFAILAGLEKSRHSGEGTKLEVSMLASCLTFQGSNLAAYLGENTVPTKLTRAEMSQSYALVASDRLPFAVHLSTPAKFWESLCKVVERVDLITDERFSTKKSRVANYHILRGILQEIVIQKPRQYWIDQLKACDVPSAPILNIKEALNHPQVQALKLISHSPKGGMNLVSSPISNDGVHLGAKKDAPILAADTNDVLNDLGIEQSTVNELRDRNIIS